MQQYIARRLLQGLFVIIVVTLIIFLLVHLGGDPVRLMLPEEAPEEAKEALRIRLGLDQPLHYRYFLFLQGLMRGDLGDSFRYNEPAVKLVMERLPTTATLAFLSMVLSTLIAIPLGILAAIKRNTLLDLFASSGAVLGRAMPNFWLGIMLILFFAVFLGVLPVSGFDSPRHLILPVITLGTGMAATVTRLVRSTLLEVIGLDYIRTARAKGLSKRVVLFKHALRNTMIPVITVIGLQVPALVTGAVITESVFAIPGVGRLTVAAVSRLDMAVVQASVLVVSIAVVLVNIGIDIIYTIIDPRVRYD